ncbi:hypothetical protein BRAS3843_1330076 [Bradyrhizobium sp. STM 3843]|nr:hypothetical protein BRAS3843_1330076 [Bradyrhizobium sp. STM 3843]
MTWNRPPLRYSPAHVSVLCGRVLSDIRPAEIFNNAAWNRRAQAPAAGRLAAAMATNCATTRRTRLPVVCSNELKRRIEIPLCAVRAIARKSLAQKEKWPHLRKPSRGWEK